METLENVIEKRVIYKKSHEEIDENSPLLNKILTLN
jgi:hypothetical protein